MHSKIKAILMALVILLPPGKLLAQNKSEKINTLMTKMHQNGKFDGAILVANKEGVIYKNGFGEANTVTHSPNKYNTLFYIASLSKPFTALLIMQLVQSGKIDLGNTLAYYFPGLKNGALRNVSIHQLLSHTSGIPEFLDNAIASEKIYSDQWFTEKLNTVIPDSLAGKKFRYTSSTYVLLAHIIEKVTGKSYAENLSKNIFKRSGMNKSGNSATGQRVKSIAKGYIMKDSTLINATFVNPAIYKGAGSAYSTAEDLYRFDQALYTDKLVAEKYKELLFTGQEGRPYGYGWFTGKLPVGKVVFHEGDLPGYTCLMLRATEKKFFVALICNNQSNDTYKQEIVKQILMILNENDKPN